MQSVTVILNNWIEIIANITIEFTIQVKAQYNIILRTKNSDIV